MDTGTFSRTNYRSTADRVARGLQRPAVPAVAFTMLAVGIDTAVLTLAVWFAAYLTAGVLDQPGLTMGLAMATASLTCASLWAVGAYRLSTLRQPLRSAAYVWIAAVLWTLAVAPINLWPYPHSSFFVMAAGLFSITLLASHALIGLITRWAQDFGLTDRSAVLVGGGKEAAAVLETMQANNVRDIRVVGLFDDRTDARSPDAVLGVPKLGMTADLVPFARQAQIDVVIIAFPLTAKRRIRETAELLRVLPVDVHLSGLASSIAAEGRGADLITLSHRPITGGRAMAKRVFDAAVACLALILLAPLLMAVALAVKLTSTGPVFFRQKRHGYNNTEIEIFKFRSMYVESADQSARRVVQKDDPRVTPVGRFIRRWSLDELPQLINVVTGDLSLVGPRPHVVNAVYSETTPFEDLVDGYAARHRVLPGITGWAQINGWRGEIDDPERLQRRVEHDLYYIENSSLWFDLWILLRTIPSLLNTKYAY